MTVTLTESLKQLHQRVVDAAVCAPSAENTQPWLFLSDGDTLRVALDPARRLESDVDGMLDLTGIGAAIENAVIAARAAGYETDVDYGRDGLSEAASDQPPVIATLQFTSGSDADPLARQIGARCTIRRMQGADAIPPATLAQLTAAKQIFPGVQLDWIADRRKISRLARLVGLGNRIRFEHEPFHAELYRSLRFSPQSARQTRDGLDVATLQLPPGVPVIMHALRRWPRMKWANRLGFSRGVARQAAREVRQSAALGILSVEQAATHQFIEGGRAFERLWLTATSLGLALHPTASLPVFLAHARRTDGGRLLPKHLKLAKNMSTEFDGLLPKLAGRTVQMVFRLGHGQPAEKRSLRRAAASVVRLRES